MVKVTSGIAKAVEQQQKKETLDKALKKLFRRNVVPDDEYWSLETASYEHVDHFLSPVVEPSQRMAAH